MTKPSMLHPTPRLTRRLRIRTTMRDPRLFWPYSLITDREVKGGMRGHPHGPAVVNRLPLLRIIASTARLMQDPDRLIRIVWRAQDAWSADVHAMHRRIL